MLYWIPFRAVRRIVRNQNVQFQVFGQPAQVLFDDVVPAVVGASTVAKQQQRLCVRIQPLQVFAPKMGYVVANELTGVMAVTKTEVALVSSQVVDAVRDNLSLCVATEIVVIDLVGFRRVARAIAVKIAEHFFFLGVNAQHWQPPLKKTFLYLINSPKLFITTLNFGQTLGFQHFALLIAMLF